MTRIIDTGTDEFTAEVADGVAVLTMNRPQARNAMSGAMMDGLRLALADVELADDVRCVVLTGAGGAFCAGGDVKGFAKGGATGGSRSMDQLVHNQRLDQRATSGALWKMPKPTVAVIGGPAAGAGLSMALACDLRVAVEGTVITTAFAKVGFSGDYGGSFFMSHLIGASKAKELYYLSDRLTTEEAKDLGLINRVFPVESFEDDWRALVARLATGPTIAYRYMKENVNRAATADMTECLDMEAMHHLYCGTTQDHLNASKAFVEKREPVFEGR